MAGIPVVVVVRLVFSVFGLAPRSVRTALKLRVRKGFDVR